jgi:ATP-dependent exoDNAse (exonuclease V) beta subunit
MTSEDWLTASERLRQSVTDRYGSHVLRREWPIHVRRPDGQEANGSIDLLAELDGGRGWVIVDHKSFPGTEKDAVARCGEYWPQLDLYREAVEAATGKLVVDAVVHLPILGIIVRRS